MRKTLPSVDELLDLVGSQICTFQRESGAILDSQMCAAIHYTLSSTCARPTKACDGLAANRGMHHRVAVVTRSLWTSR